MVMTKNKKESAAIDTIKFIFEDKFPIPSGLLKKNDRSTAMKKHGVRIL